MQKIDLGQITHLIFDWDGTLMDSTNKIVVCMQGAAELSLLPIPSAYEVHQIIGISLVPAIERLFNVDRVKAEEVSAHYKQIFLEKDQTACVLFDGALQGLELLAKQFTLGVATGKARRGLERALNSTNTRHLFAHTMTADDANSKPSPDMLEKLISTWNIAPTNAIMIGDTHYDMQMAAQIGMPRLGVAYGAHSAEQIMTHAPIAIVNRFSEIPKLLLSTQSKD